MGGTFKIYKNWPQQDHQETLNPELGKAILFRADKMHHSAEYVNTVKRAITLFINIKKVPKRESTEPVVQNSDMDPEM